MARRTWLGPAAVLGLACGVFASAGEPAWVAVGTNNAPFAGPSVVLEAGAVDPPTAPPPTALPDPTQPKGKLKDVLNPPKVPGAVAPGAPLKLPTVAIRARIVPKGRPAAAVLEVDGRQYTVTAGTQFAAADGLVFKVAEVTATEVRLEIVGGSGGIVVH